VAKPFVVSLSNHNGSPFDRLRANGIIITLIPTTKYYLPARFMLKLVFDGSHVPGYIVLTVFVRYERAIAALAAAEGGVNIKGDFLSHDLIVPDMVQSCPQADWQSLTKPE
jgi:hypothetical protein